jgi:hypothetical protein
MKSGCSGKKLEYNTIETARVAQYENTNQHGPI